MDIGDKFNFDGADYTIGEKVEVGGFSEVFKATCALPTRAPLAVKLLLPHYANDSTWRKRFEREAKILANIDHPHVVRIRATLDRSDGFAIIQDFVENATKMREYFRTTNDDAEQQLSIALQVLYGLRQAHTSAGGGAIHRDLSPSNVLVNAAGHAWVIDFGLAKAIQSGSNVTIKGPGYGTPGCVSPEQAKDFASATHLSDIYAVGRTLTASYQDRDPEHVECAKLPEPWQSVCSKMTAYDAEERHQSCDDAIEDLLSRFIGFVNEGKPIPIAPANLKYHAKEFQKWKTLPSSWPAVARHCVDRFDYTGICRNYK